MTTRLFVNSIWMLALPAAALVGLVPASIAMPHMTAVPGALVATMHAQGAQVYECKVDASGKLAWQFREPVATLVEDGKTVGRHYAGPNWELADGSVVAAKVVERAPGASPNDIPLLNLEVVSRRGDGRLADVVAIQRLNTKGGVADGPCDTVGAFLSVPYAADYAFYRKARWSSLTPDIPWNVEAEILNVSARR